MTVKQKQCLLAYLGYYEGQIDSKYGPVTQMATEAFQSDYQLTVDGIFGPATEERIREVIATGETLKPEEAPESGDFWDDIEYFTREEFRCKCGGKFCDGFPEEPEELLVRLADRARKNFGAPATVISGLRCRIHNANCGGVANSQHMYGEAVDLCIEGVSGDQLLAFMKAQPEVRYTYKINDTNVHFDIPKGVR